MTRRTRLYLLILLLAVIGCSAAIAGYYAFYIVKVREIPMNLKVGAKVAFNTEQSSINFGTVYRGGESRRQVRIVNQNDFPVVVTVVNRGNVSAWVSVEKNGFEVMPRSNESIWFSAVPPDDARFTHYSGVSTITVKRKFL